MGELAAGHASPRSGIAKAADPDPYSPERVEGGLSEVRLDGVLRRSRSLGPQASFVLDAGFPSVGYFAYLPRSSYSASIGAGDPARR
jgi:hypothetical protein